MNSETLRSYAPAVVRIGIGLCILWFGAQMFIDTDSWSSYIPEYAMSLTGLDAITLTYINGVFETVVSLALILGVFVRPMALVMTTHIALIAVDLGYNQIAIRDWGLAAAAFGIFFHGPDRLSLHHQLFKQKKEIVDPFMPQS